MNPEPNLNSQPPSAAQIHVAEQWAVARWAALERHCYTTRHGRLCACRMESGVVADIDPRCETGKMLLEEYEISSRRVRELQAAAKLEAGDYEPTQSDIELEATDGRGVDGLLDYAAAVDPRDAA